MEQVNGGSEQRAGGLFCSLSMYAAASPWVIGLSMIGGPAGWVSSIAVGAAYTAASYYIC